MEGKVIEKLTRPRSFLYSIRVDQYPTFIENSKIEGPISEYHQFIP